MIALYATAYFSFCLNVFIHTMYALMTNIPWLYTVHTINPYQKHSFTCNKGAHMCYILRGYRTSIIRIYSNGFRKKISLTQPINQLGRIYSPVTLS